MGNEFKKHIADTIAQSVGQNNVLTIPRAFIDATGSIDAALFLSQLLYWTERSTLPGGWVAKTYAEWHEEICLSKYQIGKAVKSLSSAGIRTKIAKWNGSPTVHYWIEKETFSQWIVEKLDERKSRNLTNKSQETSQTYTETTSEPTSEPLSAANAAQAETPNKNEWLVLVEAVKKHLFGGAVKGRAYKRVGMACSELRAISPNVTDEQLASDVQAFAAWWTATYPDTSAPRDPSKISEHWQEWKRTSNGMSSFEAALRGMKIEEYKP